MVRVTVLYPNNSGRFDLDYYLNNHLGLVHRLLDGCGLVRVEVDRGVGSAAPGAPAPFAVICHLVFDSIEHLQQGMAEHDPTLAADVPNFTDIEPQLQVSEIVYPT